MKKTNWNMSKIIDYCDNNNLDLPRDNQKFTRVSDKYFWVCNKHNYTYNQSFSHHKEGKSGCPYCSKKSKWDLDSIKEYCKRNNLDLPKENQKYKGSRNYLSFICSVHGEYKQLWDSHKRGHGCPKCSNNIKLTSDQYNKKCKKEGIDLPIENYKGAHVAIRYKCSKGHIYKQTPHKHSSYPLCKICNASKGERFIINYLDENEIPYEFQKSFPDLNNRLPLRYDFYLPDNKILIEYQGEQHYRNAFKVSNYEFQQRLKCDDLKRSYAIDHNMILLEPTYKLDTQSKVNRYLEKNIK